MAIGLLGALALTVGGLLRLVRPLAPIAGRLLICTGVAGALATVVGLAIVTVRVGWLHARDDIGLIGDALIAYFIGAGLGVPVFAVREFLRGSEHDTAV
jgi:hypothetical protein